MAKVNKVRASNGLPSGQKEPPRPAEIKIRPAVKAEPTPEPEPAKTEPVKRTARSSTIIVNEPATRHKSRR